jgi:hypothetical protein
VWFSSSSSSSDWLQFTSWQDERKTVKFSSCLSGRL